METFFLLILVGAGAWYCYKYMKSDFQSSVNSQPTTEIKPKATATTAEKPSVNKSKAATKSKPAKAKSTKAKTTKPKKTASKADDLKKLDGIGPKIAALFKDQKVDTFAKLAKLEDGKLSDLIQEAGVRVRKGDPQYWKKQADLAAQDKWDEVKKLQLKHKSQRSGSVAKAA